MTVAAGGSRILNLTPTLKVVIVANAPARTHLLGFIIIVIAVLKT